MIFYWIRSRQKEEEFSERNTRKNLSESEGCILHSKCSLTWGWFSFRHFLVIAASSFNLGKNLLNILLRRCNGGQIHAQKWLPDIWLFTLTTVCTKHISMNQMSVQVHHWQWVATGVQWMGFLSVTVLSGGTSHKVANVTVSLSTFEMFPCPVIPSNIFFEFRTYLAHSLLGRSLGRAVLSSRWFPGRICWIFCSSTGTGGITLASVSGSSSTWWTLRTGSVRDSVVSSGDGSTLQSGFRCLGHHGAAISGADTFLAAWRATISG